MDKGNRPHARDEKVGAGSVGANKTDKVDTGSNKPVGAGGRPPQGGSGGQQRPQSSGAKRAATGGSSMLLVLFLAFMLLKSCGGQSSGSYANTTTNNQTQSQTIVTAAPTQAPAVTAAPTQAPTAAPTQAPAAVTSTGRAHRYVPKGGGRDTVTIMVYMCGTDLESNYGMATSDLQEMASAKIGSNVNVIVETGGCKMWKNKIVSNASNQIYKVESGGVRLLDGNLGRHAMVDNGTLTDFIKYCKTNFPADRNILIFWDHGGGSITGYGYDELYKSAGSMDLAEISAGLKAADCTFDWIGFDACLMATLETAMVCNDYADYMIASEETEPGTGWYYTNWLNTLSQNTSVDTVSLAKVLIDDFVRTSTSASSSAQVTLSIMDLAEMQGSVPTALRDFSNGITSMLSSNNYAAVSNARASARQFARSNRINQIDLVDFANRVGTAEARQLSQALLGCVKYNKSTISNSYGVSIFFPYESTSSVRTAVSTYNQMGMDEAYTKCISSFASLLSGGHMSSSAGSYGGSAGGMDIGSLLGALAGGSGGYGSSSSGGSYGGSYGSNPLGSLLGSYTGTGGNTAAGSSVDMNTMMQLLGALAGGRSIPAEMDWMDTDMVERNISYISENYIDPGDIFVTIRSDGTRALTLSDEQWDLIQTAAVNIYVNDGEGYIDLGVDNIGYSFDGNDMLLTYAGNWLTVNRHLVAYYMTSDTEEADGSYTTCGIIPAMLDKVSKVNGQLASLDGTAESNTDEAFSQYVYLEVVFDAANPYGVITGARPMFDDEAGSVAKGNIAVEKGDRIQFLCDYYNYDGSFESTYKLGDPLTVGNNGLKLESLKLDVPSYSVTYRLTDIYNNYFWTPAWVA